MARRRRPKNAPTVKQIQVNHRLLCQKGRHEWRPSFWSDGLGTTPKWNNKAIHCECCHAESKMGKLDKDSKKWMMEMAKRLQKCYEKVAILHPPKTFSKEGI